MTLPFWKTEALSNDFVLVHAADCADLDLNKLTIEVSDRHTGIGSDGLLVLDTKAYKLRMFNPDGTEDFCGNGLRCAIDHLHAFCGAPGRFPIEHGGQSLSASIASNGEVSVTFGPCSFDPSQVPTSSSGEVWMQEVEGVVGTAITTGSTHFVVLVDELPGDEQFFEVSPKLEDNPLFPIRTSVIWTKAEDGELDLRIWERGVGETWGCGTGSAAAACVYARMTGHADPILVRSRGGEVKVTVAEGLESITLTSTVRRCFAGQYLVRQAVLATK